MPPRLHITSDDTEFDSHILHSLRAEGFSVSYLPCTQDRKAYRNALRHLGDDLELGEKYAILAYGDAAAECLDFYVKPQPGCVALIAYYPTTIPSPKTKFPPHLEILCHLAASQSFAPAFPSYVYQGVQPGFAETDIDEHDAIAASLAWTRTLGTLRKAFKVDDENLEQIWESHQASRFMAKDAAATMRGMTSADLEKPYVNHVPTMTGGIGQKDLFIFYRDYFISQSPPSTRMKLLSRTIGVDRVVDEVVISFKHDRRVDWMLPDVPATGKQVSVAMVSVVCIRGGLLCSEHVYWDQASVLVQVGLLDPRLVPDNMRKQGLKQLPVVGVEGARKVLDVESRESNELISSWRDRPTGDPGVKKMPARPKEAVNGQ